MNPGKCSIRGDFLEHQGRKLFYLVLEPASTLPHSSILFLPPFAEEMHKSRRVVACQARALAEAGYRVMLLDLSGCGDSGGDFVDASWHVWRQDAELAASVLVGLGAAPLVLWGLRSGALLASDISQGRSDIHKLVLWQPVLNGEQQVDQFLRLRTVLSVSTAPSSFDRTSLWNELRAGRSLDIAGYELSSALAIEMARVRLNDLVPPCPVQWLEVGLNNNAGLAAGSESVVAHWRNQGIKVESHCVRGDPFWRTVDSQMNPELQSKTLEVLAQK